MSAIEKKVNEIIESETEKIQKKSPNVQILELRQEKVSPSRYLTRLKARMRRKTIYLVEENHCARVSVRKIFGQLSKILIKHKSKSSSRPSTNLQLIV